MYRKISLATLLITIAFLQACDFFTTNTTTPVTRGFYHWKAIVGEDDDYSDYNENLNVEVIYLHLFDIDWDYNLQEAVPKAQFDRTPDFGEVKIVPTIFITNRTFDWMPETSDELLIGRMMDKVDFMMKEENMSFSEIQLDCDWTQKTKDHFFAFLTKLKLQLKERSVKLSVTIRLHQIAYPEKTGVPPVDRGMLMFYNMGKLESWEEENSILNLNTAKEYLDRLDEYPLPLDLALPIYSWGIIFRDNEMIKLMNSASNLDFANDPRYQEVGPNRYKILKSSYNEGSYLYKDDYVKIESISFERLQAASKLLNPYFANKEFTLTFYHLNKTFTNRFTDAQLDQIYNSFR
ncbi:MAG: hypothetical protein AAFO07_09340 [Bacteroidota bacterium]